MELPLQEEEGERKGEGRKGCCQLAAAAVVSRTPCRRCQGGYSFAPSGFHQPSRAAAVEGMAVWLEEVHLIYLIHVRLKGALRRRNVGTRGGWRQGPAGGQGEAAPQCAR